MTTTSNRVRHGDPRLVAIFRPSATLRLIERLATEYHDSCGDASDYRMSIVMEYDGTIKANGNAHAIMSLIGAIADHGESWLVSAYCPNP